MSHSSISEPSNIYSIFVCKTTMRVCWATFGVIEAYDVPDQNSMTKADRIGSLSARSYYTDGRLATDLLKINASDLRQSRPVSFPIVTRMIAFHSPVNIERETLASAVREDHVANKALENKWWSRVVTAIYPCADLKERDSFNRAQWLGTESCDWERFMFRYFVIPSRWLQHTFKFTNLL